MLDSLRYEERIGPQTRALIATHMWGNPENMSALRALAQRAWSEIDRGCLPRVLAQSWTASPPARWGDVGVFSFGCVKPIQTGEGGMIVTDDEALARELRSLRHWGDRTIEFGVRDATQLAWNGRMSEILAASRSRTVEGLSGTSGRCATPSASFRVLLEGLPGLRSCWVRPNTISDCALHAGRSAPRRSSAGVGKTTLMAELTKNGVTNSCQF